MRFVVVILTILQVLNQSSNYFGHSSGNDILLAVTLTTGDHTLKLRSAI